MTIDREIFEKEVQIGDQVRLELILENLFTRAKRQTYYMGHLVAIDRESIHLMVEDSQDFFTLF